MTIMAKRETYGPRKATGRIDRCDVCQAPAPITITSMTGTRHLCYDHEES